LKLIDQIRSYFNAKYHQALSYLRARLGPKAALGVQYERLVICDGCEMRQQHSQRFYCGACGCPQSDLWPDAELTRKVAFQRATCPLEKWVQ
jgi:hypothetical protein